MTAHTTRRTVMKNVQLGLSRCVHLSGDRFRQIATNLICFLISLLGIVRGGFWRNAAHALSPRAHASGCQRRYHGMRLWWRKPRRSNSRPPVSSLATAHEVSRAD